MWSKILLITSSRFPGVCYMKKNILSILDVAEDIESIIELGIKLKKEIKAGKKYTLLQGKTLALIFESGMKRKRFMRIADPYYLAVALDSITNAFFFLWLEAPERHPYPENPDTILDILFKGLIKASP